MKHPDFEFLVRKLSRKYCRRAADLPDFEQEARIAVMGALSEWEQNGHVYGAVSPEKFRRNFVANKIRDALKELHRVHYQLDTVSLDEELSNDDQGEGLPRTRYETIGQPATQETTLTSSRVADNIDDLTDKQRTTLLLYAQGFTQASIAESTGVDQPRVCRTIKAAQKKLERGLS